MMKGSFTVSLLFSLIISLCPNSFCHAKNVFEGLNFDEGEWAIIGVPLHNYKALPVQEELGTFITRDRSFMKSIQQDWNLPMTFSNDCDHHYALKIYRGGELVRTLEMNLHCGYVSLNGLSYTLNPQEFDRFRRHSTSIPWSRITFTDMSYLKKAIEVLEKEDDIFWYEDVSPYKYSGFFMLNIDNLPWNVNTDSLRDLVNFKVYEKSGVSDFYLSEYFRYTHGKTMDIRYLVNCEPFLAERLVKYQYLPWRAHIPNKYAEVHILALGINEKEFRELMDQGR